MLVLLEFIPTAVSLVIISLYKGGSAFLLHAVIYTVVMSPDLKILKNNLLQTISGIHNT